VIKDKNLTITKQSSPIVIRKDIIIRRDSRLTIESGVELLFEKQKGIIVHGTLEILGHTNDKVKLSLLKASTQSAIVNFRSQTYQSITPINYHQRQVRLVDGDLPSEGRVQIKLNDRWHSLCTNSKNLTSVDIKVLCHQVGYQEGHLYKWFPRRNDTSSASSSTSSALILQPDALAKSFHCSGSETSLQQCKRWNRIRSGGGICDHQSNIGIRCSRKLSAPSGEETSTSTTTMISTPRHGY